MRALAEFGLWGSCCCFQCLCMSPPFCATPEEMQEAMSQGVGQGIILDNSDVGGIQ